MPLMPTTRWCNWQTSSFMIDVRGIGVPEEVLPLANIPAIVPPFFLEPNTVLQWSSDM
jgi:hypothetical protein